MKHILLAALALAALGSAGALAADLPQRPAYKAAPVMVVPPPTWTGCYVGGNIGAAWGRSDVTAVNTGAGVSWTNTGVIGGGQIGCDYEFAGGFVIGARDMFDGTSLNSSGTFGAPLAGFTANTNTSWVNTLTARIGYAVQPNWLLYFQGGGAWTRTNGYVNNPGGAQVGQLPATKAAGPSAAVPNGCSCRTGRRFSNIITWTSGPLPGPQPSSAPSMYNGTPNSSWSV